jgi:ketosteroid isomerase-like protein
MTTQDNKQTAAEFFARFSAGDIPGAVDLLSGDAQHAHAVWLEP